MGKDPKELAEEVRELSGDRQLMEQHPQTLFAASLLVCKRFQGSDGGAGDYRGDKTENQTCRKLGFVFAEQLFFFLKHMMS